MRASPWQQLGIAPTDDEKSIRRAYTARLKQIDVDADPEAFIALRAAFETARSLVMQARYAAIEEAADEEADAPPEPVEAPSSDPVPLDAPARPEWMEDIDAVQALVFGDRSREEIYEEVSMRLGRILASPEMASIDHAARVERWAADVILSGIPRTNAMLAPVINGFGWLKLAGQWDCPPLIQAVLSRYEDCCYLDRIRDSRGRANEAFEILRNPSVRPRGHDAELIEQFLNMIRTERRSLMAELDPQAVEAWDAYFKRRFDSLPARIGRGFQRVMNGLGEWGRKLYLDRLLHVLWIGIVVVFALALAVGTSGVALFFLVPMFARAFSRND